MGLFGRHRDPEPAPEMQTITAAGSALTAATMQITQADERIWGMYPFGDEGWQTELWRLYDLIGEFRFASNWIGSACSQVRLYIAEVDENGRVQQETEDPQIAAIGDTIFGGPTQKAEAIRSIGIDLTVTGECYILGFDGGTMPDEWYVVSGSQLRRLRGGYDWRPSNLPRRQIVPGRDIVIRLWTPHPRDNWCADSPGRGALTVLVELERLTRYVFAQIDSRLINAGLLALPNDMDFPDDGTSTSAAESMTNRMVSAAMAPLQGEGTAAGTVPMMIEVPMEALGKLQFLEMASELSKQALELRTEAIRRLALAMDMPPEVLLGSSDTNHWQLWFIQEAGIKVHIEPIMKRICEGLTRSYLRRALLALGEDPDRFTFWYDTAPLTVRPERLQDTINMYNLKLVSGDAVRIAGDAAISDAPSPEELASRNMWELVQRDPSLFMIPGVRDILGIGADILPPELASPPPPPPPPIPTKVSDSTTTPVPERSIAPGAPQNNRAASARNGTPPESLALLSSAHLLVHRALERAGGRLLTRENRGRFQQVPKADLHTRLKVNDEAHADVLLAEAWDTLPEVAKFVGEDVDLGRLQDTLDTYCKQLLLASHPHDPNNLMTSLQRANLISGGL